LTRNVIAGATGLFLLSAALLSQQKSYQPDWNSLNSRPTPAWFDQAKFGIFIHWGVYSVPAWAPKGQYAEWYWHSMQDHNSPTWKFHVKTYGAKFKYQDFAPMFKARLFMPDQWAELFKQAGARYVVLTSKHHEGFCLWPSADSWNWNSVDIGPHQDLVGELSSAVRAQGLRMGVYYSLYEWYNPIYLHDVNRYVDEVMLPQMKDVVNRYHPAVLWTDGEWEHPSSVWKSTQFLAWLFNDSPVKDYIAINDRWGSETRGKDGGFYTSEYGKGGAHFKPVSYGAVHKWEEEQGIGASYGYNRNEDPQDYKTPYQLIALLVRTVSRGGNFLLDIGPTADGRIPDIMQERLLQMGQWFKTNGEAIYSTRPWRADSEGDNVWYTTAGGAVYAICLKWPGSELVLTQPKRAGQVSATLLGWNGRLTTRFTDGQLHINTPRIDPGGLAAPYAFVFKLTGVE
jgi:alpha-L-fucosidase